METKKDVKKSILLFKTEKGIKRSKPPKPSPEHENASCIAERVVVSTENDRVDTVGNGINE